MSHVHFRKNRYINNYMIILLIISFILFWFWVRTLSSYEYKILKLWISKRSQLIFKSNRYYKRLSFIGFDDTIWSLSRKRAHFICTYKFILTSMCRNDSFIFDLQKINIIWKDLNRYEPKPEPEPGFYIHKNGDRKNK